MEKMKINYILKGLFVFFLGVNWVFGQATSTGAPKLTPPSPNAASLGKYGNIPVSLYTGIPNISIPLYQLEHGSIKVPISISYHASGIKVNEEASRVGLGWALNGAGGVISRNIVGEDDFFPEGGGAGYFDQPEFPEGPNSYPQPQNSLPYVQISKDLKVKFVTNYTPTDITINPGAEYFPDTYSFNLLGYSGKFTIKRDGKTIVLEKNEKIKITLVGNTNPYDSNITWEVRLPDGTKALFEQREFNTTVSTGVKHISSWYLTKIIDTNGNEVTFTYSVEPVNISTLSSGFEKKYEGVISCLDGGSSCQSRTNPGLVTDVYKQYELVLLSTIESKNGKVTFEYGERIDLLKDKRIDKIKVFKNDGTTTPIKEFNFTYDYFVGGDDSDFTPVFPNNPVLTTKQKTDLVSNRLKLLSVNETGLPKHSFTYYEGDGFTNLPAKTSFARDHWGYYNGQQSNQSLIPTFLKEPNSDILKTIFGSMGTERNSSQFYAKAFSIKSITYPTGGKTEFEFETNDHDPVNSSEKDESYFGKNSADLISKSKTLEFDRERRDVVQEYPLDLNSLYVAKNGGTTGTVDLNFNCLFSKVLNCNFPNETNKIYFELVSPTGIIISHVDLLQYTTCVNTGQKNCVTKNCYVGNTPSFMKYDNTYNLVPGLYTWRVYGATSSNYEISKITSEVKYKARVGIDPENMFAYAGGIRIKKMTDYDAGSNVAQNVKKYNYHYTINGVEKSYGRRMTMPQYSSGEEEVQTTPGGPNMPNISCNCVHIVRSSDSNVPLNGSASGSVVGYDKVIVTQGENGELGKTEYSYWNESDEVKDYGTLQPPINASIGNSRNGNLFSQIDYAVTPNGFRKVKEISNGYQGYGALGLKRTIWGLDRRVHSGATPTEYFYLFYPQITSSWNYMDYSSEKIYDPNDASNTNHFESKTEYEYENTYLQVRKVKTSNSNGSWNVKTYKYVFDYPSNTTLVEMTNLNMITKVVEETQVIEWYKTDGTLDKFFPISVTTTNYSKYTKQGKIFYLPSTITKKIGSGVTNTIVTFNNYDDNGNVLSYTTKDGQTTTLTYFGSTDVGKTNLLKTQENSAGQKTTYDYYPLIGLSTITDPNGKVTTYTYDSFNRLKTIADPTGTLKTYAYNYGSSPDGGITPIGAASGLNPAVQECKMCCLAEAEAGSNSPINNCTNGQISLSSAGSSTGTDIKYAWAGPNNFASTEQNPVISGDVTKGGGVYTLTVTKLNSTCEATAIATTNVLLDCICPFTINTNGTTVGPLTCQQTISLVGNCVGCSTGDPLPGSENYVVNGKFNDENVVNPGFSSDNGGGFFTTNPNNLNGTFNSFGDHTGGGNMFLSGGSNNTNERVWYQTITVKPNTRYVISGWVTSAYNNNTTKVNWDVNGVVLPEQVDMAGKTGGQWMQLKSSWLSGNVTSIVLAMRKQNTQGHNWFAFDDITITETKPAAKYSWSGPDGFASTVQNPFVRNVGLKNSGTYMLTVIDDGCTKISTVNVTVSCQACLDVNPLTVYVNTNTPVSCGSQINLAASANKTGVSYTWYKINPDGTDEVFPDAIKNLRTPSITAPSVTGLTRYGYMVAAFKNGCTASYTAPVEVKCIQDGDVDIAMNLRLENGGTSVTANQVFALCADMTNQSTTRNAGSVRARILLPDCLEYVGDPWGLNTGPHQEISGHFYEDIWYNTTSREVTNLTTAARRGGDTWKYWGVPIAANQTRSMCFRVKALTSGTIVVKGQVATIETTQYQNMKDSDSEPDNGYDNGEDDRAALILNSSSNTLDVSTYQIRTSFGANTNSVEVISGNANWTATASDSWITVSPASGGNGTTSMSITLANNVSAKSRFGFVTALLQRGQNLNKRGC